MRIPRNRGDLARARISAANSGRVAKGANMVHKAKTGQGKVGMAAAAVQKSGVVDNAEVKTQESTASRLFDSLSEAADIVAAGVNAAV